MARFLTEDQIRKLRKLVPSYQDVFPPKTEGLFDDYTVGLIGEANRGIGNLNSYARIIPNPDLLIWPLLLKEALASSKIEGTQASVKDVLQKDADIEVPSRTMDVQEVINYREATKLGWSLSRDEGLPISGRVIKKIHERLMQGLVRGAEKRIAEYRQGQNAIGPEGNFDAIKFLPPVAIDVPRLMGRLEAYINDEKLVYDKLVHCGLMHYEFEAIHPFADGNGRVGRVLITLYLLREGILRYPLIYPSAYFLHNKEEYETRLLAVTTNQDWKGWLRFFLKGMIEQAKKSAELIEAIDGLYQNARESARLNIQSVHADKLVEIVFKSPIVKAPEMAHRLNVEHRTAISLLRRFVEIGILTVSVRRKKNIPFSNSKLIELLENA